MILKFRIDRRITGVRRGRKRVPICKGGVEVEGGAGLLWNQTPSSVHSLFFFFCPTDRPIIARHRAMGNETFFWDGLKKILLQTDEAELQ